MSIYPEFNILQLMEEEAGVEVEGDEYKAAGLLEEVETGEEVVGVVTGAEVEDIGIRYRLCYYYHFLIATN